MATSTETRVVNAAGVVQEIALVTFPAASTILTDPAEYDLSSSQYGAIAVLPDDQPALGVVAFGLAGLGCSALLPLTISFGQRELSAYAAAAAGGVIAFYQLGYGIAAFGVGPLHDAGVELSTVYALAAIVALAMCAWSFVVAGHRPGSASMALPGSEAQ